MAVENIDKILNAKRLKFGLSKAELGRRLNISPQLLGHYEAGKSRPKPDFYIKWRKFFGEDLLDTRSIENVDIENDSPLPPLSLNFKLFREKLKLSEKEFADLLNVPDSDAIAYEAGTALPPTPVLNLISNLFSIAIEIIVERRLLPWEVQIHDDIVEAVDILSSINTLHEKTNTIEGILGKSFHGKRPGDMDNLGDEELNRNLIKLYKEIRIAKDRLRLIFNAEEYEEVIQGGVEEIINVFDRRRTPSYYEPVTKKHTISAPDSKIFTPLLETNANIFHELSDGRSGLVSILNKYHSKKLLVPGLEDCDFAINAWGDTMLPKYQNGDILVCKFIEKDDDWSRIKFGEPYLVLLEGSVLIGRVGRVDEDLSRVYGGEPKEYSDSGEAELLSLWNISEKQAKDGAIWLTKDRIKVLCLIKAVISRLSM